MPELHAHSDHPALVEPLCQVLDLLRVKYTDLLGAMADRRDAIRRADSAAIKECLQHEREILRDIEQLDRRRAAAVVPLVRALGLQPNASLDEVVDCLEGDVRLRLQCQRSALRSVIEEVQQSTSVLRIVSESLLTHVTGLVQRMHLLCSHAAVYGRDGRVGAKRPVVSGLDYRT